MAAHEAWADKRLVRAFADLITDVTDLVRKELRLARAEIIEKLAAQVQAGIWFAVAGVLSFLALVLVIEGAVFALASQGIDLHWACLIVAGVLAGAAGLAFSWGRGKSASDRMPMRSTRQLQEAITSAKEQFQ